MYSVLSEPAMCREQYFRVWLFEMRLRQLKRILLQQYISETQHYLQLACLRILCVPKTKTILCLPPIEQAAVIYWQPFNVPAQIRCPRTQHRLKEAIAI